MQEIVLKGIDEKIYYDKCDNGLPIYMLVNDKVNNFYITLSVKYGSIDTEFKCKEKVNTQKYTMVLLIFWNMLILMNQMEVLPMNTLISLVLQ